MPKGNAIKQQMEVDESELIKGQGRSHCQEKSKKGDRINILNDSVKLRYIFKGVKARTLKYLKNLVNVH